MLTSKRNIAYAVRLISFALRFILSTERNIASEVRFILSAERNIASAFRFIISVERNMASAIRFILSALRIMATAKWNVRKGHHITAVSSNWGFRQTLKLVLYLEVWF